ncbi:unnamed protein product, partial [Amoebophrya sp. A120]|eukprot:GSA120T00009353001.1
MRSDLLQCCLFPAVLYYLQSISVVARARSIFRDSPPVPAHAEQASSSSSTAAPPTQQRMGARAHLKTTMMLPDDEEPEVLYPRRDDQRQKVDRSGGMNFFLPNPRRPFTAKEWRLLRFRLTNQEYDGGPTLLKEQACVICLKENIVGGEHNDPGNPNEIEGTVDGKCSCNPNNYKGDETTNGKAGDLDGQPQRFGAAGPPTNPTTPAVAPVSSASFPSNEAPTARKKSVSVYPCGHVVCPAC